MIEIDLTKLLQTSGLVRKKVLVRKKGGKPFWSTRWIQPGADIKEVVTSLGFEVVEETKPKVSLSDKKILDIINKIDIGINELKEKMAMMIVDFSHKDKISHENQLRIDSVKNQIKSQENIRGTMRKKLSDPNIVKEGKPQTKRVPSAMVHLQGVGDVPSIPASEVRIGDDRMFNYGGTEKIIAIDQKSPKTLLFTYDHIDSTTGKNYTGSVRNTSKVAIKELYDDEVKAQREARKKREAEKPKPEIIIPEPVVEVKSSSKTAESVGKIIGRIERDFTTLPTVEMEEKLSPFRLKTGINFQGLKKDHIASIADGLEKSIGKYNLKISYVGWHQSRKNNAPAKYVGYPRIEGYNLISFQKTATKNTVKVNEKTKDSFAFAKATNIAGYGAKIEESRSPVTIEKYKRKLAKYQNCSRWVVANSSDDPLALVAAHEGYHAVYFRLGVKDKWKANLESMPDYIGTDDPRCCSVSEYGTSSESELFAETGAAIAYGIDIDPTIKQAFEKTMEGL